MENEESKNKVFWFWSWFFLYRRKYWLENIDIKNITGDDFKKTFEKILLNQWKYDFLFIDEWQDLPKDLYEHLWIIANHISVFADDAQQLYWVNNAKIENIINWINPIQYELNVNRRNPRGLYEFALAFEPKNAEKWNLKLMTNKPDPVEVYICNSFDSEYNKILSLIDEYNWKNIAILFTRGEAVTKLSEQLQKDEIIHSTYHKDIDNKELYILNSPIITTFHSVKWLEFDIVIIPWLYPDIKNNYVNENHFFVATTRASEKLIITHHNWNSEIEWRLKKINKNLYQEYTLIDEEDIDVNDIPF